jgi:4-amino-4-deoxy-L-arabinose transferase-like glycosyltransferase
VNARQQAWLLLAVFVVAALVRLGLTGRHSLWVDEVFSLAIATGHSLEHPAATADPALGDFVEPKGPVDAEEFQRYLAHDDPPASPARVVRAVLLSDTSPPLYYLLLYGWTLVFGTSDVALRLFSTSWSLACLPLLVGVARRIGGRGSVLPACLLFALSPFAVYYSTEARMYSLLWFWVLALAWASLELRQARGIAPYLLWIAISAAGFLTHYFFLFPWMAMTAFLLIQPGKLSRKHLAIVILFTALAILPWYANLSESLGGWRITQGWLKWKPNGFSRLVAARDIGLQFFSGRVKDVGADRIANFAAVVLFMVLLVAMTWRLRMRLFEPRRLLLWFWLIAACAGPFAYDFLQRTYTAAVPRYAAAALPAAYLLAAVGATCLPARARAITLSLIIFAWAPSLVSIYQAISRREQPLSDIAHAVSLDGSPSELILVHSIPSGVLGIARYANGSAALASWVGQLGERQVPDSIHALVAGRTRIRFVRVHEVGQPAPEEDWLRENAEVLSEMHLGRALVVNFRPKDSEQFGYHLQEQARFSHER